MARRAASLLFGDFSIADAFYAPVCTRLRTYALPVPTEIDAFVDRVLALPGVRPGSPMHRRNTSSFPSASPTAAPGAKLP
jgi:glutathione S-transferase